MNVGYRGWGNPSVYQIQPWAINYEIHAVVPWPKGLNKIGTETIVVTSDLMW